MAHHNDLSWDCSDGEQLCSVRTGSETRGARTRPFREPHSEGEHRQRKVVCGGHSQSHLFDRWVLFVWAGFSEEDDGSKLEYRPSILQKTER